MKAQIIFTLAALAVIVGGLSMGCIDYTIDDAFPTNDSVLTAQGLQVKADVAERQARGFVQYTGTHNTVNVTVPKITECEVEVITYNYYPVLSYSRCFATIPENVAGFDTPMGRAYILQAELNDKMDLLYNGMTQQRYQYRGEQAYTEFYQGYYQDKLDKYTKMYCGVGNKEIGDFELQFPIKHSLNGSA